MYDNSSLDGLGFSLSKSVKKLRKSVKKRIKALGNPKKALEVLQSDFAKLQKGVNKIVAPNAEKRAAEAARLQAQIEEEKEATHTEELTTEQARRQQLISSTITLGGLAAGVILFALVLRRK